MYFLVNFGKTMQNVEESRKIQAECACKPANHSEAGLDKEGARNIPDMHKWFFESE